MKKDEFLSEYHHTNGKVINADTMHTLMRAMYDNPECNPSFEEIRDMFSDGQVVSKQWLLTTIAKHALIQHSIEKVLIVGGWYGLLAKMLNNSFPYINVCTTDIDARCEVIFNNSWANNKLSASTVDMMEIEYNRLSYDLVINTAIEHLPNPKDWLNLLPTGQLVVLQSNNYESIDDHVSCVSSITEFVKQTKLSQVIYADSLEFPMYTRYMIIGIV